MQATALESLLDEIKKVTGDNNGRARVAISLVQLIPYDKGASEKGHIRYPYEVLYTHTAVCSEKTKLLVYLLQELGFGTAIFKYYEEHHDAVGIQCPVEYSYMNSGYCYVETTSLSMITDSEGYYVGRGEITSTAEIIPMSQGASITDVREDYNDLQEIKKIIQEEKGNLDDNVKLNELLRKYGFKD